VGSALKRAHEALERPRVAAAVLAAVAAFFVWQCWAGASRWSITRDEVIHIPAGYLYWTLGDFSINPEHPPLGKLLATVPLLLTRPRLPLLDGYRGNEEYRFCFLDNPTPSVLLPPRLVVVGLSVLGMVALFLFTRRLLGAAAAAMAATLYAFEPNLTAHSSLVTTDVPFMVAFFLTVATLWRCAERLTWARMAAFGLAFGAALTTKYSAVLLVPIVVLLAALTAALKPEIPHQLWRAGGAAGNPPGAFRTLRARLQAMAMVLVTAAVISYAMIWAVYGFSFRPGGKADKDSVAPVAQVIESLHARGVTVGRQPYVFCDEHRLLPHPYVAGLLDVARHSSEGHTAFLMGELSNRGWRSYFLVTFLVKTPVPLLVLLAVSTVLALQRRVLGVLDSAFLVVPIAVYFGAAIFSTINIGHRHLLPVLPFTIIIAAAIVPAISKGERRRHSRAWVAVVVLLVWSGVEAVRYRPHFISYFNQLAGGPENGYKVLCDSNLDWGQDLYLLRRWVDANNVRDLRVAYFGPSWPDEDAGIPCVYTEYPLLRVRRIELQPLHGGDLLAISANYLQGIYVRRAREYDFLRDQQPVARIGYSIFVFRIDDRYIPGS
jgi:4-amino-4-deoxy-L-arabinose transferase-like glycosyltransferase